MHRWLPFLALAAFALTPAFAEAPTLTAAEAADHIGERATVCGKVVSARYADRSRSQPTFLNLDKPYPDQVFTIVIWGSDRTKFGQPEVKYRDKRVCVWGTIGSYRDVPQIVATDPEQITMKDERR
jgi:micrococcal nuclease